MRNFIDCSILDRLNDAEFLARGGGIYNALYGNPDFPEELWHPKGPKLANLKEVLDKCQESYNASLTKDVNKVAQKKEDRAAATDILKAIANNIELIAWNDTRKLLSSGYDLRRRDRTPTTTGTVPPPANFSVVQGEHRGVLIGKGKRQQGAVSHEVQVCEGDPTVEENWRYFGVYTGCAKMELAGLEPGKQYSFRVRSVCSKGAGPWSPAVSAIAT